MLTSNLVDPTLHAFIEAKQSIIDQFEREYIANLLRLAKDNMSLAARLAKMDRMYLHRLAQKHGFRVSKKQNPRNQEDLRTCDSSITSS